MKLAAFDDFKDIDIIDQQYDVNEAVHCFSEISENASSELKLYEESDSNYVFACLWAGVDKWKIDHPVTQDKIHKQCYATKEQCIALIKEVYDKGTLIEVPGFIDVPIEHFSLDEMLAFKKEDEMALKGQDPFTTNE